MNKNITVRVRGGLGNQMFQYAYAYLLAKDYDKTSIFLDIREYKNYYWPFELDKFFLFGNDIFTTAKQKYDFKIKKYHIYQGLYRIIKHRSPNTFSPRLLKKGYLFCGQYSESVPINLPKDIFMYGYFQNASLLEPIREELCKIFSFKNVSENIQKYKKKISHNSLSISIRFAEDIELKNNEHYSYSGKDYYLKLINIISKRRGAPPQIIVTSNQIGRIIKEKWFDSFENVVYIENCSPAEQLEILKSCKDFILSNSTFSWWVSFLGSYNKDSIILVPKIWFENIDINSTKLFFKNMEVVL